MRQPLFRVFRDIPEMKTKPKGRMGSFTEFGRVSPVWDMGKQPDPGNSMVLTGRLIRNVVITKVTKNKIKKDRF